MATQDPLVLLEALARKARRESAPESHAPLPELIDACRRERAVAHTAMLSLLWPAMASGLAAAAVLLLALHAGRLNISSSNGNNIARVENHEPLNDSHTQVAYASNLSDSVDPLFAPSRMDLP